ncbi:g6330 [Coccomyxa viridis]|uniref:G6330 protein n=1 Tax=Coccomyxa viridis TaxID=1274662 RepID=A0ABP1FWF1_9CHLO
MARALPTKRLRPLKITATAEGSPTERQFSKAAAKALEINLDPKWYGSLAEIGAGQEVARWFFRVGGAAGTIAKSVSAYDMTISDSMYGAAKRYVTRERVEAMLDYEFLQCKLTLRKERGHNCNFFAFADTLTTKAFNRDNECHGWLGLKYQSSPGAEPNTVVMHIRMLDKTAQLQQEAVGVLGINLIHGAFNKGANTAAIIGSLLDELSRARVEVDLISFNGPTFKNWDNRVAALRLVQKNLCDAALFDPSGELQIPQETLYKKNVLLMRGRFRPFTLLHNDMLQGAATQFFCEVPSQSGTSGELGLAGDTYDECVYREDTLVLLELTTRDMMEGGDLLDWTNDHGIQEDAFIQRIEALSTMGYSVLLSNYRRYFKVANYLATFTRESIVIALGLPSLVELFKEKHYKDLDGGILEGFGRLLKFDLRIYVYPTLDPKTGQVVTAENVKVEPSVQKLYDYIYERGTIVPVEDFSMELLNQGDISKRVTESIRTGTEEWERLVPLHVRDQIKSLNLLGYTSRERLKMLSANGSTGGNGKSANGVSKKGAAAGAA